MKLKQNKYIILVGIILFALIGYSFYEYFKDQFSYTKYYYIIKENCYERKNVEHELCKNFNLDESDYINEYIENHDPKVKYEELDAITLTSHIVIYTSYSLLQMGAPLLILIAFIGTIHSDFSSGMIKNYLLRMKYKDYFKKMSKTALKVSMLTPISLILIFILSMLFTRFNFTPGGENAVRASENMWKYNNFIFYGIIVCLLQFLINIFYCNIGLCCCKNNKNKLIAIFMGTIIFLFVNILIYAGIYGVIICKLFGGLLETAKLAEYFIINGYWFFENDTNIFFIILMPFILAIISSLFIYKLYRNKEGVIIASEKQNS